MPPLTEAEAAQELLARLKARLLRDGIRIENTPVPASSPPTIRNENRRQRSLRSCHLPAEPKPRHTPPRDTDAYVPELAARIEDDRNLTDGARRCARKLAEYIYRKNRAARAGDITVTWLMRALGKSRRTVQRYLRQLEREGYIAVEVVHARTRMCAGLFIALLAPMLPRHHRQEWPQKLMDSDAPWVSQNNKPRYKYSRESWALRCMDGVFRSFMKTHPPLPAIPITV
jgi:DNA-binding transcriptional ArsR family regulator